MTYEPMADAAFAANIPPGFQVAGGYYGGPHAYHVWPRSDWGRFPGFRLPIWVGGQAGEAEGEAAAAELEALGVPPGSITALDMETRRDITYVEHFGAVLHSAGFRVWVYGSRSTVFSNPQLNGYWVADYSLTHAEVIGLLETHGIRAVQYAAGLAPGYDASLVKRWTEGEMWHG